MEVVARGRSAGVSTDGPRAHDVVTRFMNRIATGAHVPPPVPSAGRDRVDAVRSSAPGERRMEIPPDLPTCPECLAELRDPSNRRYGYAFITCAGCGPRFSIATASPYDRPNTTMAPFRMCPECQREYDSRGGRRFQAQPNACPACGPSLMAVSPGGVRIDTPDVAAEAVRALGAGLIVAIKGTGGFHLACDAASAEAVAALRLRKRSEDRPFAVMAADLVQARTLALLDGDEERLLCAPERPIVLARRREPSALAGNVAPGTPTLGVMLPYAPIHHLLLDRFARPLAVTSGNVSGEPMAHTDEEALSKLGAIADLLILHNREIVTRSEDSVARVITRRPVVLRRSRGYVPRTIRLSRPVSQPVLACGALLKNTFSLVQGDEACLGPHIGDLENLDTLTAYREAIDRLERFLRIEPRVIAHDLHPGYLSTRYALARHGAASIAVQHHHAHVASVMAEHGLEGPVIGVAYDAAGLGTDGTAWGGEVLVARYGSFDRAATFRAIPLAGGDDAIRQPWRTALAVLDDAFDGDAPIDALELFTTVPASGVAQVRAMIRERVHTTWAHGIGRYFDAMGAIGLGRPRAGYEGQVACEWTAAADPDERGRYRFEISRASSPWQVDLRHTIRDAVFELVGGESASRVAARFHNTLVSATADLVRGVACTRGRLPVALGGGCFQNARLAEGVMRELSPEFAVHVHEKVPPGDGGLALGQAVVADAIVREM